MENLKKGVGKGRSLRQVWAEAGFTPEQIEEKWEARLELIRAVRRRQEHLRKERLAASLMLGDAAEVAVDIERNYKELTREFRVPNRKGVRSQASVVKDQQRRQERERRKEEAAYNPKIAGLEGLPGITTDKDGLIGLRELRQQRPDIFEMKHIPIEGAPPTFMDRINELRRQEGREDKFYDSFKGSK